MHEDTKPQTGAKQTGSSSRCGDEHQAGSHTHKGLKGPGGSGSGAGGRAGGAGGSAGGRSGSGSQGVSDRVLRSATKRNAASNQQSNTKSSIVGEWKPAVLSGSRAPLRPVTGARLNATAQSRAPVHGARVSASAGAANAKAVSPRPPASETKCKPAPVRGVPCTVAQATFYIDRVVYIVRLCCVLVCVLCGWWCVGADVSDRYACACVRVVCVCWCFALGPVFGDGVCVAAVGRRGAARSEIVFAVD